MGILLGRSTDCVLAILAALKAGACYVPIDPTLPNDRRKLFLEEAGVTTLVTTSSLIRARPGQNLRIISLDEAGAAIAGESEARLGAIPGGDAPAYLTFTAPMSDHPLAVLMPHRALVRMVRNTNFCTLTGTDVILGSSPVWGNGWVFEIWGSLLNGGRLVLHRAGPPASGEIARVIRDYGVTTLYLTASQLHPTTVAQPESLSGLRRLIVAGGVLPPTLARQALTHLGSGELIYAYGPVESTGIACYHRLSEDETPGGALPIGHPVSNTRVYVLDRGLQPVPVGVRGELWIGGDGLSVGYLNDARLTAQRFLPDRFSNDRSRHMFGTGDIVRYRPDGTLELFGPAETEITIRGFRVDPTKVERLLSTYPGVESAAVIARERDSGEKWLLAYFTPHKGAALKIPEVRAFLRGHLPEYAIPSAFVTLPTIPRQANGTIDHRSLPEPAAEDPQSGGASDGLQTQLRVVWEQVLGVSDIGVHDNFFELGGNSFRAINMVSILEKSIRRKVPIATLYRGQTIASMALALREEAVDLSLRAVAIQPGGARPPLFVVPGVSGDVVGYEALARALGPEQPVYVLRSVGLDGEAPPLEDIQSIGASLVSEVRRVQPRGPYNLAGFCMGGIVAYEMAQQLVSQGNQTGLVALVDTNAPEVLPVRTRRSRLAVQWAFLVRGVSRHVHAMLEQPRGQRLRYILRKSRIVTEMLQQGDIYRGDTHPLYAELVSSANLSATASYRPLPFPGKLRLILSTEGDPQIPGRDPRLSWGELARDGSATTRVQGKDSGSLLKPPNVLSLAEVLTRELDSPGGEAGDN